MSKHTANRRRFARAGQYVCTVNCATPVRRSGAVFGPPCLRTEYGSCAVLKWRISKRPVPQLGPSFLFFQPLPNGRWTQGGKKAQALCTKREVLWYDSSVCWRRSECKALCSPRLRLISILPPSAAFFSAPSSSSKMIPNWWEVTVYDCLLKV